MDFLKSNKRFSFMYDGKSIWDYDVKVNVIEDDNSLITEYLFEDGLKVTNKAKKYPKYDAYEWVNIIENTGKENTKIISELWDCDCNISLPDAIKRPNGAYLPDRNKVTKIYSPKGSNWTSDEFYSDVDEWVENNFKNYLYEGREMFFCCEGGRSSQGEHAPFFNVHANGKGFVAAVGWSGQWNCEMKRNPDSVRFKSKIQDTHFVLYPDEKIRTSSVVIMNYEADFVGAQNKWRRLVKEEFSLIGKREKAGPFCAGIWGGMESSEIIRRIDVLVENKIPVEYIWMDAGWCGEGTKPTANEFLGDWPEHTGDWRISKLIHPNGMQDVVQKIKENGKKFLLWFEPERVKDGNPITKEHREYFITNPNKNDRDMLLNLGLPEAYEYCLELLTERIETLKLDCLRIDFNVEPYKFWQKLDSADRKGMTEIKYVMNLYRLWDTLLERFPHLIIDDCASGGKRIDIETLRRSVPLWRSDSECSADYPPEFAQLQNVNFGLWMPYSGTGSGRIYDIYMARSAYTGAMTTNYAFSGENAFGDDKEKLDWFKKMGEEYLKVRPYFYGDIYPLTDYSMSSTDWFATEWNRPEENDGIVQVFARSNSVFREALFKLRGLDEEKNYKITDADGGETTLSGKVLMESGLSVIIDKPHTAKIYFYSEI